MESGDVKSHNIGLYLTNSTNVSCKSRHRRASQQWGTWQQRGIRVLKYSVSRAEFNVFSHRQRSKAKGTNLLNACSDSERDKRQTTISSLVQN